MSFKNAKETAGDIFMLLAGIGAIGGLIYAIIQVSKGNFQDYKEDNQEPFVSAGSIMLIANDYEQGFSKRGNVLFGIWSIIGRIDYVFLIKPLKNHFYL